MLFNEISAFLFKLQFELKTGRERPFEFNTKILCKISISNILKNTKNNEGRKQLALINQYFKKNLNDCVGLHLYCSRLLNYLQPKQNIFLFTSDVVCIEIKIEIRS